MTSAPEPLGVEDHLTEQLTCLGGAGARESIHLGRDHRTRFAVAPLREEGAHAVRIRGLGAPWSVRVHEVAVEGVALERHAQGLEQRRQGLARLELELQVSRATQPVLELGRVGRAPVAPGLDLRVERRNTGEVGNDAGWEVGDHRR